MTDMMTAPSHIRHMEQVELEGGFVFHEPVDLCDAAGMSLRLWDPQTDIIVRRNVLYSEILRGNVESVCREMVRDMDVVAWAMRKLDVPPSGCSAFMRAGGHPMDWLDMVGYA